MSQLLKHLDSFQDRIDEAYGLEEPPLDALTVHCRGVEKFNRQLAAWFVMLLNMDSLTERLAFIHGAAAAQARHLEIYRSSSPHDVEVARAWGEMVATLRRWADALHADSVGDFD